MNLYYQDPRTGKQLFKYEIDPSVLQFIEYLVNSDHTKGTVTTNGSVVRWKKLTPTED